MGLRVHTYAGVGSVAEVALAEEGASAGVCGGRSGTGSEGLQTIWMSACLAQRLVFLLYHLPPSPHLHSRPRLFCPLPP